MKKEHQILSLATLDNALADIKTLHNDVPSDDESALPIFSRLRLHVARGLRGGTSQRESWSKYPLSKAPATSLNNSVVPAQEGATFSPKMK